MVNNDYTQGKSTLRSTFGAKPENIVKLLAIGLSTDEEVEGTPTPIYDAFVKYDLCDAQVLGMGEASDARRNPEIGRWIVIADSAFAGYDQPSEVVERAKEEIMDYLEARVGSQQTDIPGLMTEVQPLLRKIGEDRK